MHVMKLYKYLARKISVQYLILDTSDCIVGPPVNTLWEIARVVRGLIDLGVVTMINAAVGHVHLLILSISL